MEEHKSTFSNYLTQWIHLEVSTNYEGELGPRQLDYADIKHCIQCDGYREHWSQLGTVAERMEFFINVFQQEELVKTIFFYIYNKNQVKQSCIFNVLSKKGD